MKSKDKDELIQNKKDNEIITVKPNTLRSKTADQLNLIQQRVLFYAILKVQTNKDSVSFTKREIEDRYDVDFGSFQDLTNVTTTLRHFGMDVVNEGSDKIRSTNAFEYIEYDKGMFTFKFTKDFLPALNEQKQFLQYAMKSIEQFKCKYTVYLYDFLKANMYKDRSVISNISLLEFKLMFKLKPTEYQNRNNNFKKRVWEPAMKEINDFTDYKIDIQTKGRGANTTFTIIREVNEDLSKKKAKASTPEEFECKLGKNLVDSNCRKCMRINKCCFEVSDGAWDKLPADLWFTPNGYRFFMQNTLWCNPYYDVVERVKNGVAQADELGYYNQVLEEYVSKHPDEEGIADPNVANYNKQKLIFRKDKISYRNKVQEQELLKQGVITEDDLIED